MNKLTKLLEEKIFTTNDKLTNYDIAIVFGGPSMIPTRIEKSIKLYKQNKIKKILVTGGIGYFNKNKSTPEAHLMKEYLITNNIPIKDIIVEDKSKSTKENIINSINILKNNYDIQQTKILLISSDYHIKRCKQLFTKYSKNISTYGTLNPKINKNNWYKSLSGYLTIIKEYFLLNSTKK